MEVNELSNVIIGMAINVHSALGPGLLESAYKECLFHKIQKEGFYAEKEKAMPLEFEGIRLDCGYRIDILVENKLVLELKSVEKLTDLHLAQTLTYLKLGGFNLGLLMNFNSFLLKDGLRRVVNKL
ncbi:hypothetical protein D3C87_242670 [compost metagenome]